MPTPIDRESTDTNLATRYEKQRCGGAYDAKQAGVVESDAFNNEFADGFTKGGKDTKLPKKDSSYLQGHTTKKYKP